MENITNNSLEDQPDEEISSSINVEDEKNRINDNNVDKSDDNSVLTKKESDGSQKKELASQVQSNTSTRTGSPVSHNAPIVQTPQYPNTVGTSQGNVVPGTQNPPIVDTGGSVEKSLMKKIVDSIQSLGKAF